MSISGRERTGGRFARAIMMIGGILTILPQFAGNLVDSVHAQQTPTPNVQSYKGSDQGLNYQGAFSDLAIEIDAFWQETFLAEDAAYSSPNIAIVDRAMSTPCGFLVPEPNAFYCPINGTVYLVPQFLVDLDRRYGDYAPMTVFAHEWGHHIQALLGVVGPTRREFELQADCLMGVFTRHADDAGLLDYGDFMEAMNTSSEVGGDPPYLPEDDPGAHGQPEDRVKALTRGYGGGPVTGCALPLGAGQPSAGPVVLVAVTPASGVGSSGQSPTIASPPVVANFLPVTLPLDHAACFRTEGDGTLTFEQLAARFPGHLDAATRLQTWGWQASAFRTFACDGPPRGEAGWIDVSVHAFATPASAQQAVDYFAATRAEGTALMAVASPPVGDYAVALSGPASNGKEFTIYASQGPLLIRVTGVSPSGISFADVLAVSRAALGDQERAGN